VKVRARRYCQFVLFSLAVILLQPRLYAQDVRQSEITKLADSIRSYNSHRAVEYIYVHLDKSHYLSTDTIWFKSYLFKASDLNYSAKSGLMYVEISSDSNKVIKRMMLPLRIGIAWGNIALNKLDFPEGTYTFRAYTNWIRNFGEDYVFSKTFSIRSPKKSSWLVNTKLKIAEADGKDQVNVALQFRDLKKAAIGLRPVRLRVMDGRRSLYRVEKETSLYGDVELDFTLAQKTETGRISVVAEDLRKGQENQTLSIPLKINRTQNVDLQFMPEGGNLVTGLQSEIGFKAISEDGKGINISGKILNNKMQEVAIFSSAHRGMGSFTLTPEAGETYLARLTLSDGKTKDYPLPLVKNSGTVIKLVNSYNSSFVDVLIQASPDLLENISSYSLIVQNNSEIYYAASVLIAQQITRVRINKDILGGGISRISLLNPLSKVINERLTYTKPKEQLNLKLKAHKSVYSVRDSVSLDITVSDTNGRPVAGSFSIAVTDDQQVRYDTLGSGNILSHLLITSELKGSVEDPAYYITSPHRAKAWNDLDKLLMTQGWVSFNWPEVFVAKTPMKYPAELEFTINGQVKNMFNQPVSNTELVLFSKKPLVLIDTLTDALGRFNFRNLPQTDTATYLIQSRNKRGKSFNVGIVVNEFIPPAFSPLKDRYLPWYINSDTVFLQSTKRLIEEQHRYDAPSGVNLLDEVVVTAKKIIPQSRNKNGSGNADFILDEQDMLAARKMTLFELLEKRFPGIKKTTGRALKENNDSVRYVLLHSVVNLIIDGVNISEIGSEIDVYMDYLTAEDIIGAEIMTSAEFGLSYDPAFIKKKIGCLKCPPPPVFIELTTRSGNGAFLKKTPGVYLYKPMPYNIPNEFYRPRYPLKDPNPALADLRSTIHWEPNIITDREGKARVSFYTADQPGTYTIIIEGADMEGKIAHSTGQLTVQKEN
jgi:hypothetical protein